MPSGSREKAQLEGSRGLAPAPPPRGAPASGVAWPPRRLLDGLQPREEPAEHTQDAVETAFVRLLTLTSLACLSFNLCLAESVKVASYQGHRLPRDFDRNFFSD